MVIEILQKRSNFDISLLGVNVNIDLVRSFTWSYLLGFSPRITTKHLRGAHI